MKNRYFTMTVLFVTAIASTALAQTPQTGSCISKGGLATGILNIERRTHPNGTSIDAYVLRLPFPTCVVMFVFGEKSGDQRRNGIQRVQLGPDNDAQRDQLRKLVGQTTSVRLEEILAPTSAWHIGDAVSTKFAISGKGSPPPASSSASLQPSTAPSGVVPPASDDDNLRKRAEQGSDAAAARELARRYREKGDPGHYAPKYEQLAEYIVSAAQGTAMPNGKLAGRPAATKEPSFEEMRIAARDMMSCYSIATKSRLPWDGELGWSPSDFQAALNVLTGHGGHRPDFSKEQRFSVAPPGLAVEIQQQVDRAFPTAGGYIAEAMAKCRSRFNELRPMFLSYTIDPSRREQCVKAFADEKFKTLAQYSGATKSELFAIYPDGISHADVVERPDRVRMWFAYYSTKTIGFRSQLVTGYWQFDELFNGCPTKP